MKYKYILCSNGDVWETNCTQERRIYHHNPVLSHVSDGWSTWSNIHLTTLSQYIDREIDEQEALNIIFLAKL